MVECNLAKVEVAGSNPVSRSKAEAYASAFFLFEAEPMIDGTEKELDNKGHRPALRFVRLMLQPSQIHKRLYWVLGPSRPEFSGFKSMAKQVSEACGGSGVVWVTCPYEGRGCSVTAMNLAGALAQQTQTTLVDLRFGRPAVAPMLGAVANHGLQFALDKIRQPETEAIPIQLVAPRLGIVSLKPDTSEEVVLESEFSSFIEVMRDGNDFVVLDGPPIIPFVHRDAIARHVDIVFMVCRPEDVQDGVYEMASELVGSRPLIGSIVSK